MPLFVFWKKQVVEDNITSLESLVNLAYYSQLKKKDTRWSFENGTLLKVNQVAGKGENSNPIESTHFKFENRIQQKKTDIRVLDCPTLSCTFSEAAKIYQPKSSN